MGLFRKEEKKEAEGEIILPVQDEINTIISIMNNLGLLNTTKIEQFIQKEGTKYDKSVLNRLMISIDENHIKELKKYYNPSNIGYGEIKLLSIKDSLETLAKEELSKGRNKIEVVEELINYSKKYVSEYEKIITDFNNVIKKLESTCKNKSELFAMMDYWYKNFKEERLGYEEDINKKIETLAKGLENLPYGGYGEEKVEEFKELANSLTAVEQNKNENTANIINLIVNNLYSPRVNRYKSDVKALQTKIDLVRKSTQITPEQKDENIKKIIAEFNVMYGHKLEVVKKENPPKASNSIFLEEVNIEQLVNIDGNKGYGPGAIAEYRKACDKIMKSNLPEEEKYVQINKRADYLIETYNENKELFYRWKITQLENIPENERESKEKELDLKIDFMLSLSPEEFNKYLLEDSHDKKIAAERHNEELVIRYLAKQEAEAKQDNDLYDLRLNEHYSGRKPYSEEQMSEAYNELLIASLTDDTKYEGKFIDTVAYIDSTLAQQIYSLAINNTPVK